MTVVTAYVSTLNDMIKGTDFENVSLEEIVKAATGPVFNNAAQAWNHAFYWKSLSPDGGGRPGGALAEAIDTTYGSFEAFKEEFTRIATELFASGWRWLVKDWNGTLTIEGTSNAGTPLTSGRQPLLACDVWEHSYYIDYRSDRAEYLDAFWNLLHWRFAEKQFTGEPARQQREQQRQDSPALA